MGNQLHRLTGVLAQLLLDFLGKFHAEAHVAVALLGGVGKVAIHHQGVEPAAAAHAIEHGAVSQGGLQRTQGDADQCTGQSG